MLKVRAWFCKPTVSFMDSTEIYTHHQLSLIILVFLILDFFPALLASTRGLGIGTPCTQLSGAAGLTQWSRPY